MFPETSDQLLSVIISEEYFFWDAAAASAPFTISDNWTATSNVLQLTWITASSLDFTNFSEMGCGCLWGRREVSLILWVLNFTDTKKQRVQLTYKTNQTNKKLSLSVDSKTGVMIRVTRNLLKYPCTFCQNKSRRCGGKLR